MAHIKAKKKYANTMEDTTYNTIGVVSHRPIFLRKVYAFSMKLEFDAS